MRRLPDGEQALQLLVLPYLRHPRRGLWAGHPRRGCAPADGDPARPPGRAELLRTSRRSACTRATGAGDASRSSLWRPGNGRSRGSGRLCLLPCVLASWAARRRPPSQDATYPARLRGLLSAVPGCRPTGLPSAWRRASPALIRSPRRADSRSAIHPANAIRMSCTSGEPFSQLSLTLTTMQPRWRNCRKTGLLVDEGNPLQHRFQD
jgi:hypothetical protein